MGPWQIEILLVCYFVFFFSSRRRHTRSLCDWSSDVCSSDLGGIVRVLNGSRVVAGELKEVRLPKGALEILQVIEYLRAFLIGREAWSKFNRSEERRVGKECRTRCARSQ